MGNKLFISNSKLTQQFIFSSYLHDCCKALGNLVAIFLICCFSAPCFSQAVQLAQITPKSPNIASLERFTEVPVGLGSGTINMQIPLYEIKAGSLTIPITLNHHNNGLRTDDIPSWVGHGWNLSAGGYISYQQNGLNDFHPQNGLFPNGLNRLNQFYGNLMSATTKRFYFEDIIAGNIDAEHDEFSYSFLGNVGTFHFLDPNTSRTNPKVDLKISKTPLGFKIIDDKGNTFIFESPETIISEDPIDYSGSFSDNSAYYITRILTADNREIVFSYTSYLLQYTTTTASLGFADPSCASYGGWKSKSTITRINYLLPDEITFPNGKVKFDHSTSVRLDLLQIDPNTTAKYLAGVNVYDNNNVKVKEFNFDMSYFGNNNRLKLNSVAQVNGLQKLKDWKFEYFDGLGYPAIFSKSKDHWGYYNGSSSSNNLPKANYVSLIGSNYNSAIVPDADRTSNFNYAQAGMLRSVTYPTGGKSEFEYTQNQFSSAPSAFPFEPFMTLPSTNEYTVPIAGVDAYEGASYSGTFTIPVDGYYKYYAYKNLSRDYMFMDSEVLFKYGGSYQGPASYLNNPLNQSCNDELRSCAYQGIIFLPQGTYEYVVNGSYYLFNNWQNTMWLHAGFSIAAKAPPASTVTYPVGGGRVSRVLTSEAGNAEKLVKKYIYDDNLQNVSVKNIPNYLSRQEIMKDGSGFYCIPCGELTTVWEQSVAPMVGPTIEYGLVTELSDSEGDNGSIERYFSFSENRMGAAVPPIVVPKNSSWTSGLLYNEKKFQKGVANFKQETVNGFSSEYLSSQVNGLKVGYLAYCRTNSDVTTYSINPTTVYSEVFNKVSTTDKYNYGVTNLELAESYNYNTNIHQNSTLVTRSSSDQNGSGTKKKYVLEYVNLYLSSDNAALGLKRLNEKHMNLPIEEVTLKTIDGIEYVTQGILRTFKAGQVVPDEIYELNLQEPMPLSSFTFSSIGTDGVFVKDSRYVMKVKFTSYDPLSFNLKEQQFNGGPKMCYLYSYNNQYPIAEIVNAEYSAVESILTSVSIASFENMSAPDQATLDNFLAPLRTGLSSAQITTYTYKPLVGMTSMTDPRGMTVYYEYDSFGRLKSEKDHNGKVLKAYDYHYRGQ